MRAAQFGEAIAERAEAEFGEQLGEPLLVEAADAAGVPIGHDRHVGVEPRQLARQQCRLAAFDELLPFGAGDLVGVGQQIVERVVFFEPDLGRLRADRRHAGHVVDLVAHQRLEIDDLVRAGCPNRPRSAAASNTSSLRML